MMVKRLVVGMLLLTAWMGLMSVSGCGSEEPTGKETQGQSGTLTESPAEEPAKAAQEPEVLTAGDLLPSLRTEGEPFCAPSAFILAFTREIADEKTRNGDNLDKTRFTVTPETSGKLNWDSASELKWTPDEPLKSGVTYTLTLSSIYTRSGLIDTLSGDTFTFTYAVPDFTARWAAFESISLARRTATLMISFNAPVELSSVKKRLILGLDGRKLAGQSFRTSDNGKDVLVDISVPAGSEGKEIKVTVAAGVRSTNGSETNATFSDAVAIRQLEKIVITSATAKEGQNGFIIRIRCQDKTISPEMTWFYDRETGNWEEVPTLDICPVKLSDLSEFVTISPTIPLSFSKTNEGFSILGDFQFGDYTLAIKEGLRSAKAELTQPFETTIKIPHRKTRADFVSQGRYLPRAGIKRLPVRHTNTENLTLTVRHVPKQNLAFWLSGEGETFTDRLSDPVAQKEFKVENPIDKEATSWLDLAGMIPETVGGAYELRMSHCNLAARLILTDLGLIVKNAGADGKQLNAWVIDVHSLKPLTGATVSFLRKSGTMLGTCTTASTGACGLTLEEVPYSVMAELGADTTIMRLDDGKIGISDTFVQGDPYTAKTAYRAALYGDRGVYRPGETAHVTAVLRTRQNRAPSTDLPVIAELKDPRQKSISTIKRTPNEAGIIAYDLSFQDYAATGPYTFTLKIADAVVGELRFNVEEFVPERMRVAVAAAQKTISAQQPAEFDTTARYLFGADASGADVEFTCTVSEQPATFSNYDTYFFGYWRETPRPPMPIATLKAVLDDSGSAKMICPAVDTAAGLLSPGVITGTAAVFESGSGRSTTNSGSLPVFPDRFVIGLNVPSSVRDSDRTIPVSGVVLDLNGKPTDPGQTIELKFSRLQWEYNWEYDRSIGRSRYTRYARLVLLKSESVSVSNGTFRYDFPNPGLTWNSKVFVAEAATSNVAARQVIGEVRDEDDWDWWRDEEQETTPRALKPSTVKIETPADCTVGQQMRVTVTPPFPGQMLITFETDEILESRWVESTGEAVDVPFTLATFKPNVYISVLAIKNPYTESQQSFIPERAFSTASIPVKPVDHIMALRLTAPEKIEPNSDLTVTLDIGKQDGPVFATVAAVDEGILQLTRFKTPDLARLLFMPRALGVTTFESLGWQWQVPGIRLSGNQGGDESASSGSRVQPVKPVSLWSGLVTFDATGKATVTLKVPTYRGELRVMAAAISPTRTAVAEKAVKVVDSLVLQTTLPRFLTLGDHFAIPVFMTNLSGRDERIQVTLAATDGIQVDGAKTRSITMRNGEQGRVVFTANATRAFGSTDISVTAAGERVRSFDSATIPFLPNAPMTREVSVVKLTNGKTDFHPYLDGWNPQYELTSIGLSTNFYADKLSNLKSLIRYPYGCIEQTTSTTRPLLYVADLLGAIDPDFFKEQGIDIKLMHGVERLYSMQTAEGGFSYWPGAGEPTYWGTAYVTHLLLDAKTAGYAIDQQRIDDALAFMENTLNSGAEDTDPKYGYSITNSEPYMQFVLAKAGRGRKARLRALVKQEPDYGNQQAENIYLLKAALYLAGDRSYEADLKNLSAVPKTIRNNDWSFWSALRSSCMQLDVLESLFPGEGHGVLTADSVAERLSSSEEYLTTQEMSWCASALGRRSAGGAKSWSDPTLTLDGKTIQPLPTLSKTPSRFANWMISGASRATSLSLSLSGLDGGQLFGIVTVEGIKPGVEYEIGNHNIIVKRRLLNADGSPLQEDDIVLGDLVFIELSLDNMTADRIQNIALVDRLPAGFEIENPRLGRSHNMEWVPDNGWDISYMNIRDHQMEVFGHLESNQVVTVVYAARAVTAGSFAYPPVSAEAMYDPLTWSRTPGKQIVIKDPWKAFVAGIKGE